MNFLGHPDWTSLREGAVRSLSNKISQRIEQIPYSKALIKGIVQVRERGVLQSAESIRSRLLETIPKAIFSAFGGSKQTAKVLGTVLNWTRGNAVQKVPPFSQQTGLLSTHPALSQHLCLPLVSVILPVYNQTNLLRSSVESVLSQSYPHIELVILDDGSREEVRAVLGNLLDLPSVRLFRQTNQKLPRALTHAFQFARGELLTWTSADNLMHPHAVARLCEALLEHPEAVLAYADVALIDDNGKPLTDDSYRAAYVDPQRPDVTRLCRSDAPLGSEADNYINACFLYRRDASRMLGDVYADRFRGAEDYDFWLRLRTVGRLLHMRNEDPLYFYRVHERSMSHELITQELAEHSARIAQLLELDAQRQAFAKQRWEIVLGKSLPQATRLSLEKILAELPVQIRLSSNKRSPSPKQKSLLFTLADETPSDRQTSVYLVRVHDHRFELIGGTSPGHEGPYERRLSLPRGHSVSPLALKARGMTRPGPVLPKERGDRPVFLIHMDADRLLPTLPRLRSLITENPWAFFLFLETSDLEHQDVIQFFCEFPNTGYAGKQPLGAPYPLYSAIDWLLVPVCEPALELDEYLNQLALSYSVRKPLIVASGQTPIVAPYQFSLGKKETSLAFAKGLSLDMMQVDVLDSYLEAWTPKACLATLLRHANALAQDFEVPLPETGISSPPVSVPSVVSLSVRSTEPLHAAFLVDTLDVGGLEEVVAFLVRNLPSHGIQTSVLCLNRGGYVADRLSGEGRKVIVASGNAQRLRSQLVSLSPHVINSHYANLSALQAAARLHRPIVETIHNTYVWLDKNQWQIEANRSKYFAKALSVSQLVKRYYHAHNSGFPQDNIEVVGNAIDPDRILPVDQGAARAALGIPEHVTLFLCLGRYCYQKNQFGIMQSFAQLAAQHPDVMLLCMGDRSLEKKYLDKLEAFRRKLPCGNRIRLDTFHPEVSTVLSAADALVINSFFEGFSLAATESLLTGTPLIHTVCGGVSELCGEHGERGVVIPNPGGDIQSLNLKTLLRIGKEAVQPNGTELFGAMSQVVQNREKWRAERGAIASYARRVFHPEAVLSRYANTLFALATKS